jgi:hypothetical protein
VPEANLDPLRSAAQTLRQELELHRRDDGEVDDEGFDLVMRHHGLDLLEAAEGVPRDASRSLGEDEATSPG